MKSIYTPTVIKLRANVTTLTDQMKEEMNVLRESSTFLERDLTKYKDLQEQQREAKILLNHQELKEEIDRLNEFNENVFNAFQEMQSFDKDKFKVSGIPNKKYDDFLQPIREKFNLFICPSFAHGNEVIDFSTGNRNSKRVYTTSDNSKKPEILDFQEILEARRQHNILKEELKALKDKVYYNHSKATDRGSLSGVGLEYEFTNI